MVLLSVDVLTELLQYDDSFTQNVTYRLKFHNLIQLIHEATYRSDSFEEILKDFNALVFLNYCFNTIDLTVV